jgi:hypothetical protein
MRREVANQGDSGWVQSQYSLRHHFASEFGGFSEAEVKLAMRDNALGFAQRRPL